MNTVGNMTACVQSCSLDGMTELAVLITFHGTCCQSEMRGHAHVLTLKGQGGVENN